MSANLFAAIRPSPGDRRGPSPGDRRGPSPARIVATHRPGIVAVHRPGIIAVHRPGIVATHRRHGSSRPIAGTDRRGPSPGDRRDPMVGANHGGEFIRRYSPLARGSPLFAPRFAAHRKQKTLTHGCG